MKIRSKKKGEKGQGHDIFCYVCKRYISYPHKKEKDAVQAFHDEGHKGKKVHALAPDLGRKHRRHSRAVRMKEVS